MAFMEALLWIETRNLLQLKLEIWRFLLFYRFIILYNIKSMKKI